MCIIFFGTLDNTFSFFFGSSDWHHEVCMHQHWGTMNPRGPEMRLSLGSKNRLL